mmetsp:Transcript_8998/g.12909  ORF Transcript_8998/g.12909 Transcript_8998/m.12909 type:complete len:205 (-) Transcript_8998:104-718(-)
MPPVYLTPKSSAASPDSMAVCPIPPRRNNNVKSCQVFVGPMNVPKLKLSDCDDDDFKLGFFLAAPSDISGFGDDNSDDEALSSFVPIERAHRSRSVPTIKLRPRPSLAFAGAAIGIPPTSSDNDEEEKVTLTSSAPFVTRARAKAKKSPAAITPISKKAPSMKNSYKLTLLNSKRLKVRSPVTVNAAAAARAGTRLLSSTSRAA